MKIGIIKDESAIKDMQVSDLYKKEKNSHEPATQGNRWVIACFPETLTNPAHFWLHSFSPPYYASSKLLDYFFAFLYGFTRASQVVQW